jgi:hypothetical protein
MLMMYFITEAESKKRNLVFFKAFKPQSAQHFFLKIPEELKLTKEAANNYNEYLVGRENDGYSDGNINP